MADQAVVSGLRRSWQHLRGDLVFLPKLDGLSVTSQRCELGAVEFVRVEPVDEELIVPSAPNVPVDDVRAYAGWSAADEDQQRMWGLVGTVIEGNRVTRRCPDCHGEKRVTCRRCHGRGSNGCTSCTGSGGRMVTRTTTNADGTTATVTESESCMSCGGTGRERCHACGGCGEVTCETCSPEGTVDSYIRRSFVDATTRIDLQRVSLPGYPAPVPLQEAYVQLEPRTAPVPFDAEADGSELAQRGITQPGARLYFTRQGSVAVHSVTDPASGQLLATFIDGEPDPILTVHRTAQDPAWTADRERSKAWVGFMLWCLVPIAFVMLFLMGFWLIGVAAALVIMLIASVVYRHPVRAFRLVFLDTRCTKHSNPSTMRCSGCGQELCNECLQPAPRCPHCGHVASKAVSHLIEDGQWIQAAESKSA